jgi:uncharacterized membrane protein
MLRPVLLQRRKATMAQTTLAGHPLHPQLIGFPIGLLPFSFAMDVMHSFTGKEQLADTAYHTMLGGYLGGLAAGPAGATDYFTIPAHTESKKMANVHAALNLGIMGLYSLNLLLRRSRSSPGALPKLLSLLGTAGLVVSQWYGGELVDKLGMRVKPVQEQEGQHPREWKLPGDQKAEKALGDVARQYAPA